MAKPDFTDTLAARDAAFKLFEQWQFARPGRENVEFGDWLRQHDVDLWQALAAAEEAGAL